MSAAAVVPLSRRRMLGASTLAAGAIGAMPALARATPGDAAVFGPAAGVALLSRNENPYGPSPGALRAIADQSTKGAYYAEGGVQRLAAMIAERHGVTPDHIVIGNGSSEVLNAIGLAWKGRGPMVGPQLFWDTCALYATRQGAVLKRVAMTPDLDIDLAAMDAAVVPGTSLVHICNPNNPTGRLIPGATMAAFVQKVGARATVLVDEAYNELTDDPAASSVVPLVKAGANLIVARTFSKIYGMAGLRIGYTISAPEHAALIRSHIMSSPNTAGLAAAIASYDDEPFLRYSKGKVVEARRMILAAAKRAGLRVLPSQTNFVFVEVPDADRLRAAMAARNVMIRGSYGPWKTWSRVSTGRIEDVARYAAALPELVRA
ncbi:histidinol-phosphate transaminase [Sphingomonas sp. VNH70]|uniref:pyridoxal phosphate-dependent aminotransferase n=1 Tax=Sphingomonas silueang TaxID=3156617 RepID=UPI0032B37602